VTTQITAAEETKLGVHRFHFSFNRRGEGPGHEVEQPRSKNHDEECKRERSF